MCDFESAFIEAARKNFPGVIVMGCHFHYTQCLLKHIKMLGLFIENQKEESEIHKWLKLFTALPFIPANKFHEAYHYIISVKPNNVELVIIYISN